MSFVRLLVFIAIVTSAGLWALGLTLIPADKQSSASRREPYAVVLCGEDIPDRKIRERLENQGFSGLVSESGQWVLLDCFGSIERVPLDEYQTRIFPFDPRNDGYADKLRSLFVQDGKRFVYVPLGSPKSINKKIIEKRLESALGDIPYSFEYVHRGERVKRLLVFSLVLLFLAICALFIVRPIRLALRPNAACLVPCFLSISPLALGGAAGFALASLLAGFAVLAAGLFLERLVLSRLLCWLLPPFFIIAYCLLALFSGLSFVFALLVLAFFCGILIFALHSATLVAAGFPFGRSDRLRAAGGHKRFSPVLIIKRRSSGFAFSWSMLPFAAAALILACVGIIAPVSAPRAFSFLPSAALITEADYYAHCQYQSTFSQRTLRAPEMAGGMSVYTLGSDGLLDFAYRQEEPPLAIAPFPLSDFLEKMK